MSAVKRTMPDYCSYSEKVNTRNDSEVPKSPQKIVFRGTVCILTMGNTKCII